MRAKRIDGNHRVIVKALEQCGMTVQSMAPLGNGVPDLLVAPKHGPMQLLEVKNGDLPPSRQQLTDDEREWIELWNSRVHIVTNVTEALAVFGL